MVIKIKQRDFVIEYNDIEDLNEFLEYLFSDKCKIPFNSYYKINPNHSIVLTVNEFNDRFYFRPKLFLQILEAYNLTIFTENLELL